MSQSMSDPTMPAGLAALRVQIWVQVDPAPESDGAEFDAWCAKYDCTPLNSGRRAWCPGFQTYLRDAIGVASTNSGEQLLISPEDMVTKDDKWPVGTRVMDTDGKTGTVAEEPEDAPLTGGVLNFVRMDEPYFVHGSISLTDCWVSPNKITPIEEAAQGGG